MAKINDIVFADYALSLLAEAIVNGVENVEQYLYYYDNEAEKANIFFQKVNDKKKKFSLSRKEIDLIYDTIYQELCD